MPNEPEKPKLDIKMKPGFLASPRRGFVLLLLAAALFCLIPACAQPPGQGSGAQPEWTQPKPEPDTPPEDKPAPPPKVDEVQKPIQVKPGHECRVIRTSQNLEDCKAYAQQGDGYAAHLVGRAYERGVRTHWLTLRRNTAQALTWHYMAVEAGEYKSLRYLFNANYYGIKIPRNRMAAMEHLNRAAQLKQDWALMILAKWAEKSDPKKAWNYYLELAEKGNCHAMEKVAGLCMTNYVRPANQTLAYFWGMVVDRLAYRHRSEYHQLWGRSGTGSSLCGSSKVKPKAQSMLTKKYRSLAEREAADWKPGQKEPYLPAPPPQLLQGAVSAKDFKARKVRKKRARLQDRVTKFNWKPIEIPKSGYFSKELTPSALFDKVKKSVWVVLGANSKRDLRRKRHLSLGSGVAVSENIIITNYHVVKGRPILKVKQGRKSYDAQVISKDSFTDRCALLISGGTLLAVKGYRPYRSLKVGEKVYTVGSPKGLENTLGQGLISGLRRNRKGLHMIQTNAQISKGSSGGGLFDRFGNLIGITTLTLRDSQALNFAISIGDFTR
jgi:serine protease Do